MQAPLRRFGLRLPDGSRNIRGMSSETAPAAAASLDAALQQSVAQPVLPPALAVAPGPTAAMADEETAREP